MSDDRRNESLDEQIKLLVKTEQRLYRIQNERDRELRRMGELARFALATARLESATEILDCVAALAWNELELDLVLAVNRTEDGRGWAATCWQKARSPMAWVLTW